LKAGIKILVFCFLFNSGLGAQDNVLAVAEKMPEFPGGNGEMAIFLQKNINCPTMARENGETGKVFVKFIVDTGGKILSPIVLKSSGYKSLDNEAIRVVQTMPNWNAGMDAGKKVSVYFNLPISFNSLGVMTPEKRAALKAADENRVLAREQYANRNLTEALKYYDLAIAAYSEDYESLYKKAKIQIELNDTKGACKTLSKLKSYGRNDGDELMQKHCK
jgi:TonB family protein